MSKLILKAIPANATSATADQTLGYVDTSGSTQRVSVKAQPKTVYRLVDAKTGEVIKNQTVLRQGKHLLVTVDGVNAVDLDNFSRTKQPTPPRRWTVPRTWWTQARRVRIPTGR